MSKKKTIFILVNGILTNPEDTHAWTDCAETWIETHCSARATRMEYKSGVLTRRIFQGKRINNLIEIVREYKGCDIILVGHSNGCEIICQALRTSDIKAKEVHLVAAATSRDFNKNGLNEALESDRVGKLFLYGSTNDSALKKAKAFGWLGYIGLGYGWLGLDGPEHVSNILTGRLEMHWRDGYDHSTWWKSENFDKTMELITHTSK